MNNEQVGITRKQSYNREQKTTHELPYFERKRDAPSIYNEYALRYPLYLFNKPLRGEGRPTDLEETHFWRGNPLTCYEAQHSAPSSS